MFVLDLGHNLDFIYEQLTIFTLDPFTVNDLHGVVFFWVVAKVTVVHSTKLTLTKQLRCQNNLNLVAREGNDLASRL